MPNKSVERDAPPASWLRAPHLERWASEKWRSRSSHFRCSPCSGPNVAAGLACTSMAWGNIKLERQVCSVYPSVSEKEALDEPTYSCLH